MEDHKCLDNKKVGDSKLLREGTDLEMSDIDLFFFLSQNEFW